MVSSSLIRNWWCPNSELSLAGGAVAPWKGVKPDPLKKHRPQLTAFLEASGAAWRHAAAANCRQDVSQRLLHGDGGGFLGILTLLEQEYVTATDQDRRDALARFRGQVTCPACGGSRLRPEANSVRVGGKTISEICRLPIAAAVPFFQQPGLSAGAASDRRPAAERNPASGWPSCRTWASTILTLHRSADTLSGGELQRVRAGHQHRLGTGRRVLRAGRALDRPAPARQPPLDRRAPQPAATRQLGAGRRARRGHDAGKPTS